jgi:hypothetical protein
MRLWFVALFIVNKLETKTQRVCNLTLLQSQPSRTLSLVEADLPSMDRLQQTRPHQRAMLAKACTP